MRYSNKDLIRIWKRTIEKYYDSTTIYDISYSLYIDENYYHSRTKSANTEYNNEIIFNYVKDLNLIPLTFEEYTKQMSSIENDNRIYYSLVFKNGRWIVYKWYFLR